MSYAINVRHIFVQLGFRLCGVHHFDWSPYWCRRWI